MASLQARAWSTTKRIRRQTSRGRPSANPSSRARQSRTMRSSSSAGERQWRSSWQRAQERQPGRDGPALGVRRDRAGVGPRTPAQHLVEVEVVVAARQERGTQRADDAEVVGGVVGRSEHHEQVADGPAGVDERARLGPERDPRPPRGPARGTGARCGPAPGCVMSPSVGVSPAIGPGVVDAVPDGPALPEREGDGVGDVGRLRRAQRVGLRPDRRAGSVPITATGGPAGGAAADRVAAGGSRAATGPASPRRVARPSARRRWCSPSRSPGSTVRKLELSSTGPPASGPNRARASRNVAMSARRNR